MNLGFFVSSWPGRIAALALAGVLAGGVMFVARANQPAAKPDLRTTTVAKGNVTQTVSVSGSVSALGQAKLAFKTGGRIAQIFVGVGQNVTAGQPLAKLDTTDLETALATAQQNLASAQASYQKQQLAAADTQRALEDTQRNGTNSIASAQTSLNKLKTNYQSAKFNYTSLANQVRSDSQSLQASLDSLRASVAALLVMLQNLTTQTLDVKAATNAVNQAQVTLDNGNAYSVNLLSQAINEFNTAQAQLTQSAQAFDDAIGAGNDTIAIASNFQTQNLSYTTAATRLGSALDSVTSAIGAAQGNLTSAQNSLNSTSSSQDASLGGVRATVQNLLVMVAQATQGGATAKSRITQAGSAISTVNDAIQGSYVNAIQSLQNAQDNAASSLRQAQSNVANIPFNLQSAQTNVDNASNTLSTAKSNLDNAVLAAPSVGIVAAIANQIGEYVSGGGTTNSAFITLTNSSSMVLHGTVGEADVAKLKLGQVANVIVDALAGQRMTGKVTSLDPVATISQGVPVYGVDVAIDIPSSSLKAGMSGTAAVILASKQGVLTVPNTTIRTVNGQRGVQVLKDGEVVETAVQFGIANDTVTEVVSGLAEGDVVVIPQARAGASAQPNRGGQGPGGGPVFIGR